MNSISLANNTGISLSLLNLHLRNNFHIPKTIQDSCLQHYNLLHWTPEYFLSQLQDGLIHRNVDFDITKYQVIYHKCTPAILKNYKELKLSFRIPTPTYGSMAYVLVTPIKEGV